MEERTERHCPNPNCPAWRVKGNRRFLCEIDANAYLRIRCHSCKTWYVWNNGELEEVGTMVLEDSLSA